MIVQWRSLVSSVEEFPARLVIIKSKVGLKKPETGTTMNASSGSDIMATVVSGGKGSCWGPGKEHVNHYTEGDMTAGE